MSSQQSPASFARRGTREVAYGAAERCISYINIHRAAWWGSRHRREASKSRSTVRARAGANMRFSRIAGCA